METCSIETHHCQCPTNYNVDTNTNYNHEDESINGDANNNTTITSVKILTWELNCIRFQNHAETFNRHYATAAKKIKVEIECVHGTSTMTRDDFHSEILSQAKTQTSLVDGYTLGPHLFGDLDLVEGLYDMTSLIRNKQIGHLFGEVLFDLDWNDIFLFSRENGATYDSKIVGIPIDGDVHSLYYRTDLFARYNKTPPQTWEQYTELAKFFHGRQEYLPGGNNNTTTLQEISGSCIGKLERTEFWVFLILSSMTQYAGTSQGAFFDVRNDKNMEPLLGEAFVKTLQYMEEQFAYGASNEMEGSFKDVNLDMMNQGKCAMTYMWGDSFSEAAKAPPASRIAGFLGVAPTPGSTHYLNRDTQRLEKCTHELCSCSSSSHPSHSSGSQQQQQQSSSSLRTAGGGEGLRTTTTTCINSAPYAAYTGWAGSCSNYTSDLQKRACAEFLGYVSSAATSLEDTIPNVTKGAPFIIVDPYRNSQIDPTKWVERGLPEESTREYLDTISAQLSDPNVVLDMRIPRSADFQSAMNEVFRQYLMKLQARKEAGLMGEELYSTDEERWETEKEIRKRWRTIIDDYDLKHPNLPLLEAYQRNLGIYYSAHANYNSGSGGSGNSLNGPVIGALVALVAVVSIAVIVFVIREKQRSKSDDIWKIHKKEIIYNGVVVGRGRFGVVLLAEYRGTEVAVKRVVPQKGHTPEETADSPGCNTSSFIQVETWMRNSDNNSTESSPPTTGSIVTTEQPCSSMINEATLARCFPQNSEGSGELRPADRKKLIRDFKEQMRLLSTLRHPCVHAAVGAVVDPGEDPLLIMFYMNHGSLYDIIHNETMNIEGPMLLQMLGDITQGMRYLHACTPQVIHCDLKASNILVDSSFRAKISDFGLSPNSNERSGAIGSPFWMSPELLNGARNSAASDVYAFGIVVYEMFSGKEPYEGENAVEVLKLVCDRAVNKRPPMPKDCPPQIDSLMRDCLVPDAKERPTFEELDKRVKRVDEKDVLTTNKVAPRGTETCDLSLRHIFPKHMTQAVRDGEKVEPEQHDMVTIFFSDIVGFEHLSCKLEARKVADMVGRLYDKLDSLTRKHTVFKVETIGDKYMAVTNLVEDQGDDHAKRIAEFATDAIEAARNTYVDMDDPKKGYLNIRVGIHSGPVVADVVGSISPRFCLFGDTVNLASGMESHSQANRIHCSFRTARLLQMQNPSLSVTSRGAISVKGKGSMCTFWVNPGKSDPGE